MTDQTPEPTALSAYQQSAALRTDRLAEVYGIHVPTISTALAADAYDALATRSAESPPAAVAELAALFGAAAARETDLPLGAADSLRRTQITLRALELAMLALAGVTPEGLRAVPPPIDPQPRTLPDPATGRPRPNPSASL